MFPLVAVCSLCQLLILEYIKKIAQIKILCTIIYPGVLLIDLASLIL